VEDGVPPPRAAPALLRRVVLNLSTVRRSCSPPFGCGARNTSTTSSCRSPSTALGPLGTRTSTTGRGKERSTLASIIFPFQRLSRKRANFAEERATARAASKCCVIVDTVINKRVSSFMVLPRSLLCGGPCARPRNVMGRRCPKTCVDWKIKWPSL